jgi:uracil-DNA glycosylase
MDLFEAVRACRSCPEVEPGSAVLGPAGGPIPCDILFIGEAPGRRGAARTGVPFSGDESGRRFERLLAEAGLSRDAIFVTNAVLCLPLDLRGNNRPPKRLERANCAAHLAATIELVDPRVIVTLGATALAALRNIAPHDLALCTAAAVPEQWAGRTVVPLYHTSQQARINRDWKTQVADWRALGVLVTNLAGAATVPNEGKLSAPVSPAATLAEVRA